ncbi:nucleotide-binding universal stress UspA family protein [Kitasatospora sp. MAA4]|uniref:universal stress protein n=1 Tax=Kitasatospora sp. MAA4 TaxID=3035093 RepID=UPI002474B36E|nr:universal stress protein [Kitasatospora sp. MAA4]MDH6132094.1 nucleotide-binding universal stress UspA family protein [Kitasatospora sp. MAA4]
MTDSSHNTDGHAGGRAPAGFELGTDGPRTIVVGLDGSESSYHAAAYGAGLARRQGARVAFVYVQPVLAANAMLAAAAQATTQEVAEGLLNEIRQAVERLGDLRSLRWEFHTFQGDPYHALAKTADDLKADAVIVGVSEHVGHRIVGSVAVRLVRAGRWPVTVVP